MTAAELIRQAAADGVEMRLTAAGRLRLVGDQIDVDRWLAVIAPPAYRDAIVAALRAESGPPAHERRAGDASPSTAEAERALAPEFKPDREGIF